MFDIAHDGDTIQRDSVKWLPNGRYTGFVEFEGTNDIRLQITGYNVLSGTGTLVMIATGIPTNTPFTFTIDDSFKYNYARLFFGAGTYDNVKVYPRIYPADIPASPFEIYNGQSVTVPLVDSSSNPLTVYGGTLEVMTGTLTVTHGEYPSYNGETLPGVWLSDRDAYAPGTTPTTGAQVVYELETPLTYQLTPAQISTLAGYNAVSADAGPVSVTYRADTALIFPN